MHYASDESLQRTQEVCGTMTELLDRTQPMRVAPSALLSHYDALNLPA